ncbi:hypothetical protein ATK36_4728 [Amycolatopsis sulphurea]|uniref:Uncharacterized protein n=1 Tax=Amycolatopsis sulphurea TaxID=76022 RepID=A0A2A9FGL8_9PSEU|nr:hypothetical protein ATK36_4728 [Amycolatopsis sulphurea]
MTHADGSGWHLYSRPAITDFMWREVAPQRVELVWSAITCVVEGGVETEEPSDRVRSSFAWQVNEEDIPIAGRHQVLRVDPSVVYARMFGRWAPPLRGRVSAKSARGGADGGSVKVCEGALHGLRVCEGPLHGPGTGPAHTTRWSRISNTSASLAAGRNRRRWQAPSMMTQQLRRSADHGSSTNFGRDPGPLPGFRQSRWCWSGRVRGRHGSPAEGRACPSPGLTSPYTTLPGPCSPR